MARKPTNKEAPQDAAIESQMEVTAFDVEGTEEAKSGRSTKIPVLVCLRGDYSRESILLSNDRISFGRLPQCDVALLRPNVSRLHAYVERFPQREEPGGDPVTYLIDNRSKNGTYLNGERIKDPVPLKHGDTVAIGDFTFGYFIRLEEEILVERQMGTSSMGLEQEDAGIVEQVVDVSLRIVIPEDTFTPRLVHGRVMELTQAGMRFATEEISRELFAKLLSDRRFLRCMITFPGSAEGMNLNGRVAWLHLNTEFEPPECTLGIEFRELTRQSRAYLNEKLREILSDE